MTDLGYEGRNRSCYTRMSFCTLRGQIPWDFNGRPICPNKMGQA